MRLLVRSQTGTDWEIAGNILTVADDLLKNDGQKFLEMMEQLAEHRTNREDEAADSVQAGEDEDDEDIDEDEDEEVDLDSDGEVIPKVKPRKKKDEQDEEENEENEEEEEDDEETKRVFFAE